MSTVISGKVITLLEANNNQFKKKVGESQKQLKGFESSFNSLKLAGVVAFTAIGAIALKSIKSYNVQENAVAKLTAVLKATGNASGFTSKQLQQQAADLQKLTTYGDESIISMQGVLASFVNIKGDVFKDATKSILDMSSVMGTDLKSSALQLGKALNDPMKGISALTRVGVSFTEVQKNMIKSFVEGGNVASAQQVILNELAKEFGGTSEAMAKTFGGQLKQMSNAWGDLKEEIGKTIAISLGFKDGVNGEDSLVSKLTKLVKEIGDFVNRINSGTASKKEQILYKAGAVGGIGVGVAGLSALVYKFVLVPTFGLIGKAISLVHNILLMKMVSRDFKSLAALPGEVGISRTLLKDLFTELFPNVSKFIANTAKFFNKIGFISEELTSFMSGGLLGKLGKAFSSLKGGFVLLLGEAVRLNVTVVEGIFDEVLSGERGTLGASSKKFKKAREKLLKLLKANKGVEDLFNEAEEYMKQHNRSREDAKLSEAFMNPALINQNNGPIKLDFDVEKAIKESLEWDDLFSGKNPFDEVDSSLNNFFRDIDKNLLKLIKNLREEPYEKAYRDLLRMRDAERQFKIAGRKLNERFVQVREENKKLIAEQKRPSDRMAGAFARGSVEAFRNITQRETSRPDEKIAANTAELVALQKVFNENVKILQQNGVKLEEVLVATP